MLVQPAMEQALRAEMAAKDVLIAGLHAKVAELTGQVAELLARLNQNLRNSDRSPSSQGYGKPAPRSRREVIGRPSGGQQGYQGLALLQVTDPDAVVVHAPPRCSGCGHSLVGAAVVSTQKGHVFDLPEIHLLVTERQVQHRRCDCGHVTMGEVSAGVGGPAQYGPKLGTPISQGTVHRRTAAAANGLDSFLAVLTDGWRTAPVLGADETGIRVDGALISAGWAANSEHHGGARGQGKRPKHLNLLERLDTQRQEGNPWFPAAPTPDC